MPCFRYFLMLMHVARLLLLRWLLIPLLSAERAWAQGMEIKKDNEDRPLPHKRQHSIRRLAKASAWAADLARFAEGRVVKKVGGLCGSEW